MERIREQIRNLNIPYPRRHLLEVEVSRDLECLRSEGDDESERIFSPEVLEELEYVHSTNLYRFLKRYGQARRIVESSVAFVPMFLTLFFIMEDKTMVNFIREGGTGMYVILGIGAFLLGRELLSAIRLFVVKEHSTKNLRIDTPSVLLGCLALMLAGLGSTVLGLYVSADAVVDAPISYEALMIGAKESITHIILSSFLCMFVILAHYGIRRMLHVWRVPQVD